jgi:cholesterol transport system auxiliary component
MTLRPLILVATLAGSLALGGCISLFPKGKPAQLYKLTAPPARTDTVARPTYTVLRAPTAFTRAAASDRILTSTGAQTAYIAEARWAAPASIMFDEALSAAFASEAPTVRLATRGDVTPADGVIRIEVRTFEAQYRAGQGAPPVVVVEAHATLSDLRARKPVADQTFRAEELASENRVGPIVAAFDAATAKVLGDIARFASAQAPK